ncbi:hypothetical protein HDZ31DRAFT_36813 [Schizophyllum fasciatum]
MRNVIHEHTGRWVSTEAIWKKLREMYDLEGIEKSQRDALEEERPSVPPPREGDDNLASHEFFESEFNLLDYDDYHLLAAERAQRSTQSSPAASPADTAREKGKQVRGRKRTKADDSDISELTQDSGEEPLADTPMDSVVTGTDGGTDAGEDEEAGTSTAQAPKKRGKPGPKPGRGRGSGTSTRGKKKRRGG